MTESDPERGEEARYHLPIEELPPGVYELGDHRVAQLDVHIDPDAGPEITWIDCQNGQWLDPRFVEALGVRDRFVSGTQAAALVQKMLLAFDDLLPGIGGIALSGSKIANINEAPAKADRFIRDLTGSVERRPVK